MTNYGEQSRPEPDGTGLPRVSSDMFRNPELQYDSIGETVLTPEEKAELLQIAEQNAEFVPFPAYENFYKSTHRLYAAASELLDSGGADEDIRCDDLDELADEACLALEGVVLEMYEHGTKEQDIINLIIEMMHEDASTRYEMFSAASNQDDRISLMSLKKITKRTLGWFSNTVDGTPDEIAANVQAGYDDILANDIRQVIRIIEEAQTRHDIAEIKHMLGYIVMKMQEFEQEPEIN